MFCLCAKIVALFATMGLFFRMGSHVDSEIARCCARVVALCCTVHKQKAVNYHVGFQLRRSVERIALLFAFVIFLDIRMDLVGFGHSAWKILISDLDLCI